MRRISAFLILFFLVSRIFCQTVGSDTVLGEKRQLVQNDEFKYHFSLGSEFTSISGFGSALTTYITPSVSYKLGKRFSIGGGISLIQTNYFNTRTYLQNEQTASGNGNFMSGTIFVNGQYFVNERLTISGSAYKQFPISRDPLPYNPFDPVSSRGAQGVNFNVGYQVGKNVYIQAGFRYSDGENHYSCDPFRGKYGFGIPRW